MPEVPGGLRYINALSPELLHHLQEQHLSGIASFSPGQRLEVCNKTFVGRSLWQLHLLACQAIASSWAQSINVQKLPDRLRNQALSQQVAQ